MKNLSLGSKVRYLQGATLGLFLLLGILMGSATGLPALTWVLYGLLLVLMGIVFYTVHRILAAIRVLTRNVRAAAEGNLDQRITGIKPGAATGGLAWAFNDLLDQQEAYFREVIAAFEHASRGQTYRLAMDQGLHGAFKEAMVRVNVAVESLGKVQQMALKEHLMSRVMNLNAASLNTNLKSVQAYLLNMTQELGTVGDLSATTAREAEDSRATLERLVVNLNRVVAMVGDTHSQISVLHQKGEEIAQIVQVITEVADRTNLLALNAAIEAAHAGEVGKGFAVVAEEVRTLSENTKDAAASIAATIESFGQATTRMLHDSEQVKELAEGSQGAVTEFRVKVLSFAESAQTSQKQVAKSQDFSFAALVKMDHFLYMQNGYRLVNQGTHSDEAQMVRTDHRGCRLGTWYYTGQGAELFSHLPSFNRLEEPHAAVHHNIHEVIHLLDQDWVRDQGVRDRIFHHFQSAEQASHAVVEAIDRLVAEKHA